MHICCSEQGALHRMTNAILEDSLGGVARLSAVVPPAGSRFAGIRRPVAWLYHCQACSDYELRHMRPTPCVTRPCSPRGTPDAAGLLPLGAMPQRRAAGKATRVATFARPSLVCTHTACNNSTNLSCDAWTAASHDVLRSVAHERPLSDELPAASLHPARGPRGPLPTQPYREAF